MSNSTLISWKQVSSGVTLTCDATVSWLPSSGQGHVELATQDLRESCAAVELQAELTSLLAGTPCLISIESWAESDNHYDRDSATRKCADFINTEVGRLNR